MLSKTSHLAILVLLTLILWPSVGSAAVYVGGSIAGDTVWTADDTIIVQASIDVFPGATLTIEPGSMLMVQPFVMISVDGSLIAVGTDSEPITMTCTADTAGGTPSAALWLGIQVQTLGQCELEHLDIRYVVEGVHTFGSALTLRHCHVTNYSSRGFSFDGYYTLPRPIVQMYSCSADQTDPAMIGEGQGAFVYRYVNFTAKNCRFNNSRVGLFVYSYRTYNPTFDVMRCEMSDNTEEGIIVLGCG